MIRVSLVLVFTFGLLSSGGTVPDRNQPLLTTTPASHLDLDTTGATEQANLTVPRRFSVPSTSSKRSITTEVRNATIPISPVDEGAPVNTTSIHSTGPVSNAVLQIMKNSKTLSDSVQQLSGDVKQHKNAAEEAFARLSRIELVQERLRDVVNKSTITREKNELSISDNLESLSSFMDDLKVSRIEEVRAIKSSIARLTDDVENKLSKQLENVANSVRSKYSFDAVNVTKFVEMVNVSGVEYIESDLFVVYGHTAHLSLGVHLVENETWLGIYLLLCRGEEDALLQWPFRANYTLSIFHPRDPAKDVHKTVNIDQYCPDFSEKPKESCNPGCGFEKCLLWDTAKEDGYIHNGAITVGIALRS
ncbi:uncharacterized protein LOC135378628 isoform X2 [Ornithodoros turicata]